MIFDVMTDRSYSFKPKRRKAPCRVSGWDRGISPRSSTTCRMTCWSAATAASREEDTLPLEKPSRGKKWTPWEQRCVRSTMNTSWTTGQEEEERRSRQRYGKEPNNGSSWWALKYTNGVQLFKGDILDHQVWVWLAVTSRFENPSYPSYI